MSSPHGPLAPRPGPGSRFCAGRRIPRRCSRRVRLDAALAEIDAGRREPSARWKVRFGLMLGLERVLADPEPHLASGTKLRRHQIDALAGMLTELISLNQRDGEPEQNGNGNGHYELEAEEPEEEDDDFADAANGDEEEEPEAA